MFNIDKAEYALNEIYSDRNAEPVNVFHLREILRAARDHSFENRVDDNFNKAVMSINALHEAHAKLTKFVGDNSVYLDDIKKLADRVEKIAKTKKHIHVCWFCTGPMIWDSDFSFEDVGRSGEGIVAMLHCSECGAIAEFYTNQEEQNAEER